MAKKNELTPIQMDVRAKMINLACEQGLSLSETEDIFRNPLSRARIHQILIASTAKKIKK